ncbi:Thaumatin-like protein 1 [Apostasia shenzhenica]|uniref:Thaumatin-like protein 1 n=1 Tax=Apostasia shenzhenica TaxID=1088818 RepID=A0A2I0BF42_9ASPA|nr:Thaumatin-like protein 1 [Apostasia shenzhenica]
MARLRLQTRAVTSRLSDAVEAYVKGLISSLIPVQLAEAAASTTFQFSNQCSNSVWVGTLSGSGKPQLAETGFELSRGSSSSLDAPAAWSGRFWGRTFCSTDCSGRFSCLTGDCNTGRVTCDGSGGAPPATLIEITLGGTNDFYDVSLVDGYNLEVAIAPVGGSGDCRKAGCQSDLNGKCPSELAVKGPDGSVVACKSACEAFGSPIYCCTGQYGSPTTCGPTGYSRLFKRACPMAYSYAYDDQTSTFTCNGPTAYTITFCP